MQRRALLLLLSFPLAAQADPVKAHYSTYAAGLNVMVMDATMDLSPSQYRLDLEFQTAGAFALLNRTRIDTQVRGAFEGGRAAPQRFYSAGTLRGEQRLTLIDYVGGQPALRQLSPAAETEREPVSPEQQRSTVDTLSAMAQLIHQVNQNGRCDGAARTFDGRRMAQMRAWTIGPETLAPTRRSSYAGPALHCEFEGRQLAGFRPGESREDQELPQRGGAWFAAVTPGGPQIPVLIRFHTRWFGDAMMYLDAER